MNTCKICGNGSNAMVELNREFFCPTHSPSIVWPQDITPSISNKSKKIEEDIDQFNFNAEQEADENYSTGWDRGKRETLQEIIKLVESLYYKWKGEKFHEVNEEEKQLMDAVLKDRIYAEGFNSALDTLLTKLKELD